MTYLNKFKFYILSALIIFSSAILLTGCGKKYTVTISKEAREGYAIFTSDESEEIKANSKYEIYISAEIGYSLDGIIVKVNNSAVEGVVKADIENDYVNVTDETGIDYFRTWTYTIDKVTSDLDIIVDISDCGLVDCTITLSNLENQNAFYAKGLGSDEQLNTNLNQYSISTPKAVVNNQAHIKYGQSIYILLNESIDISILNSNDNVYYQPLTKYEGVYYKYNGKFVYFFRYVTHNFTIVEKTQNYQNDIYTTEKLATIAFAGIGSDAVNLSFYGYSLDSEPTGSLSGEGAFWHSYLYLGDKNNFEDEQIENNLSEEYLSLTGKKAYYRLSLNPNFYDSNIDVTDVASFYLVYNIYDSTTNLTELTIKKDSIGEYLEIDKADIEKFISNDTAGLYLKTVIKENALAKDYFGLKLNYLNNDLNTGLTIHINELQSYPVCYNEFLEDDNFIYYFHKSQLYNGTTENGLNIWFGNNNYFGDMPYVLATEIKISRLNNTGFIFSDIINYPAYSIYDGTTVLKNHGIPLIDNIKNVLEITVKTTYQNRDTSTHSIDFNTLLNNNYEINEPLFITNSINNPQWIEVTEDNLPQLNNLTISVNSPLYFYSHKDYMAFPLDLYNSDMKMVSAYSLACNVRGNVITIINDDYTIYLVYALYLKNAYLPENAQFQAHTTTINVQN
jgi:hypothetical protein